MTTQPQTCTVDDLIGGDPCPRLAQWTWQPNPDDHPVHLCNYHADPLIDPKEIHDDQPA